MSTQIQEIKKYISNNQLGEALQEAKQMVSFSSTLFDNFYVLERMHQQIEEEYPSGLLTREAYSVEKNRLSEALLDFLEDLQNPVKNAEIPIASIQIYLEQLIRHFKKQKKPRELLRILGDYNELLENQLKNLTQYDKYKIEMSNLKDQLQGVLKDLNINEEPQPPKDKGLYFPILVIAHKASEIEKLRDYFIAVKIRGVIIKTWSEELSFEGFKIIVFDNRDLMDENMANDSPYPATETNKRDKRIQEMEKCIKESRAYLFHYGNQLYWINGYRNLVHAANSKFALYNRICEMINFIEAFSYETKKED